MSDEPEVTWTDRSAFAFIGALTGAAYGALIALAMFLVTEHSHLRVIWWSALVFACMGFISGNFLVEALLGLLHFLWGFFSGVVDDDRLVDDHNAPNHLRAFALMGLGTGFVLLLWWHY